MKWHLNWMGYGAEDMFSETWVSLDPSPRASILDATAKDSYVTLVAEHRALLSFEE